MFQKRVSLTLQTYNMIEKKEYNDTKTASFFCCNKSATTRMNVLLTEQKNNH